MEGEEERERERKSRLLWGDGWYFCFKRLKAGGGDQNVDRN